MNLIEQLANIRKSKNISQQEVAKRLGTHQPIISRFESGRIDPSISFTLRYISAINCRLEVLDNEERGI